jgi:hypothetical protein
MFCLLQNQLEFRMHLLYTKNETFNVVFLLSFLPRKVLSVFPRVMVQLSRGSRLAILGILSLFVMIG